MNYAFEHEGKAYTPDGQASVADVQAHNKALEMKEIDWLKTGPERLFLYVKHPEDSPTKYWEVSTWLGTVVSDTGSVGVGARQTVGFQSYVKGRSYRRAISCRIFGVLYHGWYMESSGNYCRLKKAKKQ